MALVNIHFLNLQNNYLFADIAKKVNAFKVMHPKADVISLGIGDVTQPLCPAVVEATVPRATPATSRNCSTGTTSSASPTPSIPSTSTPTS